MRSREDSPSHPWYAECTALLPRIPKGRTMDKQVPLDASARADIKDEDGLHEVLPDLAYQRQVFVNVVFYGIQSLRRSWVLIDAGLHGSADRITAAADKRYGPNARPLAIVMTHGHFDHVGALETLVEKWQVPVYAHHAEFPYLDGSASYPDPDPTVGGGMMARLSPMYPKGPVNVRESLRPLPGDGSVPVMPGWQWIHTP